MVERGPAERLALEIARLAGLADNPMFGVLTTVSLTHAQAERRFLAAFVIKMSAHRDRAATGCAAVVDQLLAGERPLPDELLHRVVALLAVVGDEGQRDLLTRLALDGPVGLRASALLCLGRIPAPPGIDLLEVMASSDDAVARAGILCAGMTGDGSIATAADDATLPEWRRTAATWWRDHGPAIHEPATAPG